MFFRLCLFAALMFCLLTPASAQKQRRQGYRSPSGPTLSPYLLYRNFPSGPLDNYHSFVRPTLRLQSTIRTQGQQLRTLERDVRTIESTRGAQIRRSDLSPTGHGATFMNLHGFFPGGPANRR